MASSIVESDKETNNTVSEVVENNISTTLYELMESKLNELYDHNYEDPSVEELQMLLDLVHMLDDLNGPSSRLAMHCHLRLPH